MLAEAPTYDGPIEVNLLATKDVGRANIFRRVYKRVMAAFQGEP